MSLVRSIFRLGLRKKDGVLVRRENWIYPYLEKAREENKEAIERNQKDVNYGLCRDVLNLDEFREEDLNSNNGFILDPSIEYYSLMSDESKLREKDSIFSHKFGNYKKDGNNIFMCECGATKSETAGEKCPVCKTFTDKKVYKRGWFILKNGFRVFNPDYYNLMIKHLDSKKIKMTKKAFLAQLSNTKVENQYNLLSLMNLNVLREFINNFIKDEVKEFFLSRIERATTNSIPVISNNYRFYKVENTLNKAKPNIKYHSYNAKYVCISNTVQNINTLDERSSFSTKMINLDHLNKKFLELYKLIMDDLGKDKKKSLIRGKTSGKYKHASCKIVIDCDHGLSIDEIKLPFNVFGVIVNRYYKSYLKELGLSPEGFKRLESFRPTVGDKIILNMLLKRLTIEKKNICTVLRPPSIYKRSIMSCRIIGLVNTDSLLMSDLSLGFNLRGDKDGDTAIVVLSNPLICSAELMTYHPSAGIFNQLIGEVDEGFEIPESQYYIVYETFEPGENRHAVNGKAPTIGYDNSINPINTDAWK